MYAIERLERKNVEFLRSPLLEDLGFVRHAFSTRLGGVSEGRYASLNLGRARGEDPDRVAENRRRFFEAARIEPSRFAEVKQVHGIDVLEVPPGGPPEGSCADALMTDEPGVIVSVKTADCVPVLFADPKRRAVAAAHAGWRGTARGILQEVIRRMGERYSSRPADLVVSLGPAISGSCYEVGEDCLRAFGGRYPDWRAFSAPVGGGKWLLDLSEAVRRQIVAAGVPEERVGLPGPCTFSESLRFFSYRRDGPPVGRLMSVIGVS